MKNTQKESYDKLNMILKAVMLLFLVGILVTGGMLIKYSSDYKTDRKENELVREIAYGAAPNEGAASAAIGGALDEGVMSAGVEAATDEPVSPIDFDSLKEINPDIVGWIIACGGEIDGPVVQTDNNSYYLDHRFDKSFGSCGTFFADSSLSTAFESSLTVVYGHNRKDGSMFHPLLEYKSRDYLDKNPEFVICTEEGMRTYRIFSAYFADNDQIFDENFVSVSASQATPEAMRELYTKAVERSLHEVPDIPEGNDIVILSTCEYSGDNNRMVVYGICNE